MSNTQKIIYRPALLLFIYIFLIATSITNSQQPSSSSEILLELKKLNVLGSVLYIAAHPDDENTAVLAYMSKGELLRTAYLSLTRGDGGQNLLGSEKGDLLGVLRTQELLSARRIDGGEQFFSRAIDFGYSKTPDETLNNWDRELILSDIVKVIRQFKPDVIITRFSKTSGGHGHHLSSAILAEEAFYAAADPKRFPEQLNKLKPWQAKRIYWNTWRPSDKAISIDIGGYNPLLGEAYSVISALGRSMHKSQGFGVSPNRGSKLNYFDYMAGDAAKSNLFDDIILTWDRVDGGKTIKSLVDNVVKNFNYESPENSVTELVKIYKALELLNNEYWAKIKMVEVKNLIQKCSGFWMEATVGATGISPGKNIDLSLKFINQSGFPMKLETVKTQLIDRETKVDSVLEKNKPLSINQNITIPTNSKYSQPYWLREPNNGAMFNILSPELIGKAENGPALLVSYSIRVNGELFTYSMPAKYKWNDAVKGEQFKPFVIRPDISLSIDKSTYVYANNEAQDIRVQIESKIKNAKGNLRLTLPEGWIAEPNSIPVNLQDEGDKKSLIFKVTPSVNSKDGVLKLIANINGKEYSDQIIEIDYPHIPMQTVMQAASAKLIRLDIKIEPKQIGYIMGSGDEIPDALTELGYRLDLLSDNDLDKTDLSKYDVIICGVRAFNTREQLDRQQKKIIKFVDNGGTWIVQHNTRFGKQVDQIGPYPFSIGRDRIAEENANLKILSPEHQIFNYPNKISENDFNNWVQERGLYFAKDWDKNLTPLLSGNDTGETPKLGGLLYSNYGKGVFIFTSYSWFRQLPAGVPGAYRLFVNMISARGNNGN